MTTKTKKSNKNVANVRHIRDERATNVRQVRYVYAPILQEFRAHTKKNEARLWIPIETNLISRYEFAACSLPTRYIFVAIVLYCAGNGIDAIPLDAKFMSSVLVADSRTIEKSFEELLLKNLLVERKEREEKKEQTDRQDAHERGVSVDDFNSFQNQDENKNENGLSKIVDLIPNLNGNGKHSQFTIEECLKYVEACQAKGDSIQSPKALANHLSKTGDADAFILATLYPEQAAEVERETFGEPIAFTDVPCSVCFGARLADVDGRGHRKCEHCRDERGKSTGFEPKGERDDEV